MGDIHNQDQYLTGGATIKDASGDVLLDADGAASVADDAVDSDAIATDAVDSDEIATGAVDSDEIAVGAVDVDNIEGLASAEFICGTDGTAANNAKVTISGDVSVDNTGASMIHNSVTQVATFNINAAGIKGLAASPVTVISAFGAATGIVFEGATLKLVAGSEVLSEAADNLVFNYTNGAGVTVSDVVETTGFIDQAANTVTMAVPIKDPIVAQTGIENQDLVLWNNNAEIAGNASNDAELRVTVKYRVIQL
jgi:hypothetical protein